MAGIPYLAGSATAASGGSTSLVVTISTTIPSGDSINIGILKNVGGVTITSVTDTKFNTYLQAVTDSVRPTAQLDVWECENSGGLVSGTDTVTIVYSANTSVQGAIVVGDNNIFAGDKAVSADAASGTTASIATGVLAQAEENVIAFLVTPQAGGVPTWTNPTGGLLANISAASTTRLSAQYGTVASIASTTPSATIVSAAWCIGVVTEEVNPPLITTTPSPGIVGVVYSQMLVSTGGVGTYTYTLTAGGLPTGLSLAAGVISGTPTIAGLYSFTITVTDSNSVATPTAMTISILAPPVPAASLVLSSNILTLADSSLESGVGTWAADVNASSVTTVTTVVLTGAHSLAWTSTAGGLTQVHTGFYNCLPGMPYIASAYIYTPLANDCFIGIEWYTSGSVLIRTDLGTDFSTAAFSFQPVSGTFTAPANAAEMRVFARVAQSNTGDVNYLDLAYAAQASAQVLIDFQNSPYAEITAGLNPAGQDFQDVSMFVKLDSNGITITRGRQDAISEISAGTCTFQLQNDTGLFTRKSTNSLITTLGGNVTLGRRCQVNLADQNGAWYTRFDGALSQIDYTFDNTGSTSVASIGVADVLSFLQRSHPLGCWTLETVLGDNPGFCWPMSDAAGNGNAYPVLQEVSGNSGPVLRPWNSDTSLTAFASFQSSTGGIETLANAISAASGQDGSEFWNPGSDQPSSQLRGLDSGGTGPYTTPSGAVYFSPKITPSSAANNFVANAGFQYNAYFPDQIINSAAPNSSWSVECWFTMDPTIKTAAAASSKVGPYTILSLGSSRQNDTIVAALYMNNTTTLNFEINTYSQPPAFIKNNFAIDPTILASSGPTTIPLDGALLPHHLVLTISGNAAGASVTGFLDGVGIGVTAVTTRAGATYDTLCIGGAYGGYGCHFGSIQMASIYPYSMSLRQIQHHCSIGQYGMWEATTDDTIAAIGQLAEIPAFWNSLTAHHNGLTLCDYTDLSGTNALSNMQIYEQGENGLLYVNAAGQLSFYTRDWKMGYGAPDLLLGPDTFDSAMGYQVVDQFLVNEAGISVSSVSATVTAANVASNLQSNTPTSNQSNSIIVQGNWTNQTSQNEYGPYAVSTATSPLQLPLIAWSRGYANLGIGALTYWPDPNLSDLAQWKANHNSEPFMSPGQLVIDTRTLSKTADGIGISDLYALEIGNMIAPSGTVPGSFPNATGAMEWFIEGISETFTQSARTWSAYTSPAQLQRAWKPGDPVYGLLGTTSLIGVSAPDVSAVQADGKDVAHDGGPPYWPPTFTTTQAINPNPLFAAGSLTNWTGFQGSIAADNGTLYPGGNFPWSAVLTSSGGLAGALEGTPAQSVVSYSQGFEVNTGGWAGVTNCTVATSVTQAKTGTHSLKMTTTATGSTTSAASVSFSVAPNQQITVSTWVWATAVSRTAQQGISVYDANGNILGVFTGAVQSVTNGAWTQISDTFTMPANAASVLSVQMSYATPASSEAAYFDDIVIQLVNNSFSVGGWVNSIAAQTVSVGVDWVSPSGTYLSTTNGSSVALQAGVWTFVTAPNLIVPASGALAYPRANAAVNGVIAVQNLRMVQGPLAPADMNNPAQNGHGFIGALDIRGMHDSLARMLRPPMVVVGALSNTQTIANAGAAAGIINWDSIYIDSEGGMGAVAGYPNWYLVSVPGFYDIDASVAWNNASVSGIGQGWIAVAADAAQAVAAGTATPLTVGQYVCPIGEAAQFNSGGANATDAPATRMYLGAGDMVAVAVEQSTAGNKGTGTNFGGSRMSLLWRGYGRKDDRVQINASLATGLAVTNKTHKTAGQYIMNCTTTYCYQGSPSGGPPGTPFALFPGGARINTNGFCFQGYGFGGTGSGLGSMISTIVFPFVAMRAAVNAVSGTVTSITVAATNVNTYSKTGGYLDLGWSGVNPGGGTYNLKHSNDHPSLIRQHFNKGQAVTFTLPQSFANGLMTGSATMLVIGSNKYADQDLSIRGWWNGGPGWWTITVNYLF